MKSCSFIAMTLALLLLTSFDAGKPFDKSVVRKEAEKMGNALISKNYKEFARFVHPRMIAAIGGEGKLIAQMAKNDSDGLKDGFAFKSFKYEDPAEIVDTAGTLQCTLQETIEQTTPMVI